MASNPFQGAAVRLAPTDLDDAAHGIGVDVAALRAVLAVETTGSGYDPSGRPRMLYEPHLFYRGLAGTAKLNAAMAQGLAYPTWGEKPYPADSYPHMNAACALDRPAALASASWGIGQVLGANWKIAGAASLEDFVAQAMASERAQLGHMTAFVRANRLDVHLRTGDWLAFALGYNGRGQARNGYADHLRAAYERFRTATPAPFRVVTPLAVPAVSPSPLWHSAVVGDVEPPTAGG